MRIAPGRSLYVLLAAVWALGSLGAGSAIAARAGGHAAAAPREADKAVSQDAAFPSWSPDGKQIAFVYVRYPSRYRIVRTSTRPGGGTVHTVFAGRGLCCAQM